MIPDLAHDSREHVALGTDFDRGLLPPDALAGSSRLPGVAELLRVHGVAEEDVHRVMGGNARRILRAGWR